MLLYLCYKIYTSRESVAIPPMLNKAPLHTCTHREWLAVCILLY